MDIAALVADLQRLPVVSLAAANITGNVYIGQEVHFDFDHAVALTGFASAAFDVETESPRHVAARPGFLSTGK